MSPMNRPSQVQQYQGPNLPSRAVGVPAPSRAGEILAEGADKLISSLKDRQDKVDSLAAMAKFGDYQAAVLTNEQTLQKQYWDKPTEYTRAAKESAEKLAADYSKDLPTGVAQKFSLMKANYLIQRTDDWNRWGVAREQEIIIGNGLKVYQNLTLRAQAARTPKDFWRVMVEFPKASKAFQQFVSPATDLQFRDRAEKDAIENHMASRAFYDAAGLYRDLASGGYAPLVKAGVLKSEDINKYTLLAKQQMIKFAEVENYHDLINSTAEISGLVEQWKNGSLDPADVNRRLMVAKMNQGALRADGSKVFSDQYVRGLENLRSALFTEKKLRDPMWQQKHDAFLSDFDRKQALFLASRRGPASPKDYDNVLGLYGDLIEAKNNMLITDEEFGNRQLVLETKLKSQVNPGSKSASLSEALKGAGRYHFWNNPNDVYSFAYDAIEKYMQKRSDLNEVDKAATRQQFLVMATKMIDSLTPEQMAGLRSDEDKRKAVHELMNGKSVLDQATGKVRFVPGLVQKLTVYKNPTNNNPMMVGDVIDGPYGQKAVFEGLDEKGTPMVRVVQTKR